MISGISPGLVKNQKAGGVEVAGKNKISEKSKFKENEQSSFADMIPGNKADPKNEARTDVRGDKKSSAKPSEREDLKNQGRNDQREARVDRSPRKIENQGNDKLKGSVAAGPKEIPRTDKMEDVKVVSENPGMEKIGQVATAREKAVLKFMDSFESEFGIPPQRIAEAMAELPPSLQDMSPMETATDVIDSLALSDVDKEKALEMYASFLLQLQTLEQRPSVMPDLSLAGGFGASSMLLGKETGNMEGMPQASKTQALQKYRDLKSDDGSNKGAVIGGVAGGAAVLGSVGAGLGEGAQNVLAQGAKSVNAEGQATLFNENASKVIPQGDGILAKIHEAAKNQKGQIDLSSLKGMEASPELTKKVMDALSSSANGVSTGGLENTTGALQGLAAGLAGMTAINSGDQQPQDQSQFSQNFSGQQGQQNAADSSVSGAPDFFMKETKPAEFKESLSSLDNSQSVSPMQPQGTSLKFQDVAAAAPVAIVQGDPSAPPVQQMVISAEMLLRQGGGEMKVQLNPEGLGIVDLKVALQDGKLTINMAAEEKETKKLLESTMTELKSSLGAKNFMVDSIKIDMIHSAKTDNDARSALDQNPDRGGHKQFWQNFQENFGNRSRQNDLTGWAENRGGAQRRYDPLAAADTENKASTSQSPRVMTSQRLNMVA